MYIENSRVVGYIYKTRYGKEFYGETLEEAERVFESWINSNTQYRGVSMYEKHCGCSLYYVTENGNKYWCNGLTSWYRVNENGCIESIDRTEVKYKRN